MILVFCLAFIGFSDGFSRFVFWGVKVFAFLNERLKGNLLASLLHLKQIQSWFSARQWRVLK